jgi:alpha-galactosidase
MTDEEYKVCLYCITRCYAELTLCSQTHFSMWAALKSPLLIGADIRELSSKTLTILNNPAVIAVNQDPLGRSATQIFRDENVKKDKYGQGEIQIWSGPLWEHDQLVIFLNAADEDLEMTTSMNDIFVHEGPEGSAMQTKHEFDVYDLWADRMEDFTADQILAGKYQHKASWYNSTQTPYQEGLARADPRLLGKRVGSIGPKHDSLRAQVPRHGVRMFRLRNLSGSITRYAITKDEL